MADEPLNNLARIGQMKDEARNLAEVARRLKIAKTRREDSKLTLATATHVELKLTD